MTVEPTSLPADAWEARRSASIGWLRAHYESVGAAPDTSRQAGRLCKPVRVNGTVYPSCSIACGAANPKSPCVIYWPRSIRIWGSHDPRPA